MKKTLPSKVKFPYSYVFGRHCLNSWQHRIMMQIFIRNKEIQLHVNSDVDVIAYGDMVMYDLTFKLSDLLAYDESLQDKELYESIKTDLISLQENVIQYEKYISDGDGRRKVVVTKATIVRSELTEGEIRLRLSSEMWDMVTEFTRGFRLADIRTIYHLNSKYAIRFYEMFCDLPSEPRRMEIDELRSYLQLENKYKLTKDLIANVIEASKKEMDEVCPVSFEYNLEYDKKGVGRPYIVAVIFYVIDNSKRVKSFVPFQYKSFDELEKAYPSVSQLRKLLSVQDERLVEARWNAKNITLIGKLYESMKILNERVNKDRFNDERIPELFDEWIKSAKAKRIFGLYGYVVRCIRRELLTLDDLIDNRLLRID